MSAVLYKNDGPIDFVAAADVKSGDILALGTLKGIVVRDQLEGELATLDVEGVFKVPSAVTDVGTPVTLRTTEQDAVDTAENARYDGIVVGVYETGVSLVKLERGSAPAA